MLQKVLKEEDCKGLSDIEIVRKSLQNLEFFSCLYERYEAQLLRYIQRISALSESEAKDILQDAFIKVWRSLNQFRTDVKFSSWLYRIVHNETISYWRKQKIHPSDSSQSTDYNDFIDQEDREAFDYENERRIIERVLSQLPLKYREVLNLKFLENMSYEEVSDILKIPEGTVATRINRAKKRFKKIYELISEDESGINPFDQKNTLL